MAKELIFGHQNPDTDAIVAAISYSYLQNKLGYDTEAVALGEPNEETAYVLDHFNTKAPRVIQTAKTEVDAVMLVDHNEPQQSVSDIADVKVTHVVDHHRIQNFNTADPLYYRAEPLGCTSTILLKIYNENNVAVPEVIAGLMLSAIISDTLLLKSPTTTDEDRDAVKTLAELSHTDYQTYGLEMLKAGTNLGNKSATELIDMDAKSFDMNGHAVRVAQVNTVDIADVLQRETELREAMGAENKSKNYSLFILLITNILNSDSELLAIGDDASKAAVQKAFDVTLADDKANLPGVVSRKKQVVPQLTAAFE
ncbi:manganese-dependent inorganic pyrophosphatase [Agrilactobacillus composti DSM 18527 = JCM 14202]|uniref:Probable manganese-dependent inorganic pyrophosphatase n=1 Tax=Agrilactobacillus composti DSM 18527 = JCM 14202 TaxID=1423734 RepID=X0PDH4_9LACO|nr:manganese-dependent inorganic pyrophosphatase [Agrilactobacillus composti]KRM36523.1 manganese-dependent inorganic pyrophosphatase [Agrilactobacillus composti DSM 18527 = JCM 14202]GAF39169.1 manganese-dependent inorganic pyrophosphatase [Agrilactobacillus composti DSM 18527 = JCM 14202]